MGGLSPSIAVGIIGTGGMGRRHAHNLHQRVKGAVVAGVYDLDGDRARQVAVECGGACVFADPYELIADEQIEAVLIASPDETHAEFVLSCLSQMKPVLCEKPLATNPENAWKLVEAEVACGRRMVSVGFMRRFDPFHLAVKRSFESGGLGRPVLFRGIHRNARALPTLPPFLIVTGSAIHDIDSARWLLGQEVETVYACGLRVDSALNENATDLLLLQLSLSGNCLATIEVYVTARYGYEVTAEVVGERGVATTAQPGGALLHYEHRRSVSVHDEWLGRFQEAYVLELEQWVEALRHNEIAGASAWDGYTSLLVAEACIASLERREPVAVKTPAMPALYGQTR